MNRMPIAATFLLCLSATAFADGLGDNDPNNVRPVPKPGAEVPDADREKLTAGLAELHGKLQTLKQSKDSKVRALVPDVEIFHRAVRCALKYDEFMSPRDIPRGHELLKLGNERADQLLAGKSPWTTQTGLVVRGYRSKIDHTVQPYGLVIPDNYSQIAANRVRCDVWLHGRGENDMELNFISKRRRDRGRFAPDDTIVLHPYGRYSNAFKFAGEVDVLEALEHVKANYRIDPDRVSIRGFSMGGAGCWQFAVHYADQWFAANPGAGFSETPEFLKFFQKETLQPKWFEKKLWRMHDCNLYVRNLLQCPTVAYSGELDIQKQAADVMEKAYADTFKWGRLVHIIGPKTKHTIHPDSMAKIEYRMGSLAQRGRLPSLREIQFTTYTLKYNQQYWLKINGLDKHWEESTISASFDLQRRYVADPDLVVTATNVNDFSIHFPAGESPVAPHRHDEVSGRKVAINRHEVALEKLPSDRSLNLRFVKSGKTWKSVDPDVDPPGLAKRHNLQGPIDDAFMDSFIIVPPESAGDSEFDKWAQSEYERAVREWRRHFRGDARVKSAADITEDDIASANLVLWGNRASNPLLAKITDRLPIKWDDKAISVGPRRYSSDKHALIMIYPNPLNPQRYVVLNSGFTYREYAYLNNARQVPVLPDWAVISLDRPPGSQYPGAIADADFFDEKWQIQFSTEN